MKTRLNFNATPQQKSAHKASSSNLKFISKYKIIIAAVVSPGFTELSRTLHICSGKKILPTASSLSKFYKSRGLNFKMLKVSQLQVMKRAEEILAKKLPQEQYIPANLKAFKFSLTTLSSQAITFLNDIKMVTSIIFSENIEEAQLISEGLSENWLRKNHITYQEIKALYQVIQQDKSVHEILSSNNSQEPSMIIKAPIKENDDSFDENENFASQTTPFSFFNSCSFSSLSLLKEEEEEGLLREIEEEGASEAAWGIYYPN